jgi:hypothetical protein
MEERTMLNTYAPEASIQDWLRLIRAEYLESPGLHLTKKQVERLWGLDTLRCKALLDALVDARFLRLTDAGMYTRVDVER